MKAFFHNYFKTDSIKFVSLVITLGFIIASEYFMFRSFNLLDLNNDTNLTLFDLGVLFTMACLYLSIAISFYKKKNLQGLKIRIPFILLTILLIPMILVLIILLIVAFIGGKSGNNISFFMTLVVCSSPFFVQFLTCLQYFELAKLEKQKFEIQENLLCGSDLELDK